MIHEREENVKTFDNCELSLRIYTPRKKIELKGYILIMHGFSEHSGRYLELAKTVCKKNIACVLFDMRGHGNSGPARGDTENLHALILDILFMKNHAAKLLGLNENSLLGLVGHSFGGLLVTYAAAYLGQTCPPIFLSSPCYQVKEHVAFWKKFLALKTAGVVPRLRAPIGIKFKNISNNPKNNEAARRDPLFLSSMTARMGHMFLHAVNEQMILQSIRRIHVPVAIVAGGDDKLVNVEATKKFAPAFLNPNSFLKVLEGAGHEIFNETEKFRGEAFRYFNDWLDNIESKD